MILDLVKPHKISFIFLEKQKSFVPKFYKNWTIELQFFAIFSSTYKGYDTRDP